MLLSPKSTLSPKSQGPSPSLKKRLEEADVEARAQRKTPELPQLANLKVRIPAEGCDKLVVEDIDSESNQANAGGRRRSRGGGKDLVSSSLSKTPSVRRLRVRTLDQREASQRGFASAERMKRNTDSMLEDVIIANKLKRRLCSRRDQKNRRTIDDTGLSDFIMKSITEGSLDAVAAATTTNERLTNAADLAFRSCMAEYFANIEDEDTKTRARNIFVESLMREEFRQGDYVCRQNDVGDKLYVIEEGTVEFVIGENVAGTAQAGSIFGELSLIYGVPRSSNVKVVTPCLIVWTLDALAFRRVQALVAKESLKACSSMRPSRSNQLKNFRKQYSSLTDLQEKATCTITSNLDPSVSLKDLKRNAIIGRGTFGSVYMVSFRDRTGKKKDRYYSLKCMSKSSIVERENEKRVLIEKNALQSVASPFVISLISTHQDESSIYFLTEFVQGGNLMTYMINKDILSHSETVFFSANIVSAVIHIHKNGFIHRDIKPENCLIGKDGYLKLCDFGMAKRLPSTVQLPQGGTEVVTLAFTMCGTPEFMAPEFVLSTGYDKGVDWWALGCIIVEMLTGRSPFEFDGDLKKTFKEVCLIGMGRKKLNVPEKMCKSGFETAVDFTQQILTAKSNRLGREDGSDVQRHSYFRSIDFHELHAKLMTAPYVPNISQASDTSHFQRDVEHLEEEVPEPYDGDDTWCSDF